jgi:hypothetical protein
MNTQIIHHKHAIETAILSAVLFALALSPSSATPANKAAFVKYFGKFLPAKLDSCTTCHLPKQFTSTPASLAEFPHNSFGHRLALAADELRKAGKRTDIPTRLRLIASEDSDGDGVDNLSELLLGHAPGNAADRPTTTELKRLHSLKSEFTLYLSQYRWQPFEPVRRPASPQTSSLYSPLPVSGRGRGLGPANPIDAFLAEQRNLHGLTARPPASKSVLLRRVYLDLTGLAPTPEEMLAFEADKRPDAYERVVDNLLASPRYGERWGRHWMDVWRYSDWAGWADGNQIRDSKPFIWRWRDWIVESLNSDKGYDQMLREMLAADELTPENPDALRATGYLVRNYKLLSREQWMDDLLNHTGRAFLGLTLGCAKCHNHMYDPITQADYYRVRAVFEPHNVRTDRIPGQPDVAKDGLVHAFDADLKATTYLFIRGDERNPDKSRAILPGIPESLGGALSIKPVPLTRTVSCPDRRDFVIAESIAASESAVTSARKALEPKTLDSATRELLEKKLRLAEATHSALLAVLDVERIEDSGDRSSEAWKSAAINASARQRTSAVLAAEIAVHTARAELATAAAKPAPSGKPLPETTAAQAKVAEAEKALAAARTALTTAPTTAYQSRITTTYPAESTGRRVAFARWLTDNQNPLTARVAVNQIWMRHFGVGIVPSVDDFGRNGRPPSNPKLLDWLAAELMAQHWKMKPIHRLIVTSNAYRMASNMDAKNERIDPDDVYLWRMPSRRMEAELVRDNILYVSGSLDETLGGPEIDHTLGLTSKRRSIYLQTAAEKQAEFLQIFDGPSVTECYARKPSVMPQQALALANSDLAIVQAKTLSEQLSKQAGASDDRFVQAAFLRTLNRRPTVAEKKLCADFMSVPPTGSRTPAVVSVSAQAPDPRIRERKRMNLILVLFNHNDFVTIR